MPRDNRLSWLGSETYVLDLKAERQGERQHHKASIQHSDESIRYHKKKRSTSVQQDAPTDAKLRQAITVEMPTASVHCCIHQQSRVTYSDDAYGFLSL